MNGCCLGPALSCAASTSARSRLISGARRYISARCRPFTEGSAATRRVCDAPRCLVVPAAGLVLASGVGWRGPAAAELSPGESRKGFRHTTLLRQQHACVALGRAMRCGACTVIRLSAVCLMNSSCQPCPIRLTLRPCYPRHLLRSLKAGRLTCARQNTPGKPMLELLVKCTWIATACTSDQRRAAGLHPSCHAPPVVVAVSHAVCEALLMSETSFTWHA